jgi:hypothetical protein
MYVQRQKDPHPAKDSEEGKHVRIEPGRAISNVDSKCEN